MLSTSTLSGRRGPLAFAIGVVAVTAGVLLHMPMVIMGRMTHYRLAGMPMGTDMYVGMALIVGGVIIAGYGLLPRNIGAQREPGANIAVSAPEDAELGWPHWWLMTVLVIALIIDVMKPAALGFAVPGMTHEYGVARATASLVAFFALVGTVFGSLVWGTLADIYGRKATILLSAILFVGTAICGAMPSLEWNIFMCFMMGAAAGGMLPVTYALLAEMMPSRHRGWSLVLVGGLGAIGGYFAASGASALWQSALSWRILFLLNLPTGLILVVLGIFIPESAKFLIARGRPKEALEVMKRFGAVAREVPSASSEGFARASPRGGQQWGRLAALSLAATSWGLINFGLLLWLPGHLQDEGYSVSVASRLLAQSALLAFPTVFLCALIYSRWSTKWSLVAMIGVTIIGLLLVLKMELLGGSPVLPVTLLILGSNGILAVLLPYCAESFPLRVRGRTTGWVAACTKAGGVGAQALSITALVPSMAVVALLIALPTATALGLVAWFGKETRGRDLRILDPDGHVFSATSL